MVVPELRLSQYAFHEALQPVLEGNPVWLDLGCGHEMLPTWFRADYYSRFHDAIDRVTRVVGLDYDEAALRANRLARKVRGEVRTLPFAEGVFDLVSANMMVEHLEAPEACLREVRRVLKPSGLFVLHTPNVRSPLIALAAVLPDILKKALIPLTDQRPDTDIFPTRYRQNTPAAIRACAKACALNVREVRTICTGPITGPLGPLVLFELLVIRALRARALAWLRPVIIAILERPAG